MKRITTSLVLVLSAFFLFHTHNSFAQSTTYGVGTYTVTVPAGVTTMQVTATGAAGGTYSATYSGGKGGRVVATYAVTPGTIYYVFVGAKGANTAFAAGGSSSGGGEDGGFGGNGPNSGYPAGAGSDVRTSVAGGATTTASLNSRIIVGGGGGGATGGSCSGGGAGGNGGNPATAGGAGGSTCSGGAGGGPGTQVAGGARGGTLGTATAGSFGMGGNGGYSIGPPTSVSGGAGGGGGGWYGGGAAYNGGGGGGSSYASTTGIIGTATFTNGTNTGDGEVIICFSAGAITGPSTVCPGGTINLTDITPGGTWSSSNSAIATVDAFGTVYGTTGGSTIISYAVGACPAVMTVNVANLGAITGTTAVCAGSTTTLSSTTSGGVWSSDNSAVATISGTTVYGASAGSANISYTAGSCSVGVAITVSPGLAPITGATTVCQGSTEQLSSSPGGGAWSSSSLARATVNASTGLVYGVSAGAVNISYTSGGCSVGWPMTVIAMSPITGPTAVCAGSTIVLSDVAPGGAWSSDNTTVATVSGPTVYGVSPGTANISYTSGGCAAGLAITVTAGLTPITGSATVCQGSAEQLSSSPGGGVWTSTNTSRATVDAATGLVSGVSAGAVNISYAAGGCSVGWAMTVIAMSPVTGPTTVCAGSTITLSNAAPGGVWTSDNTTVATVSGPTVTGVATGTANISYTSGGCAAGIAITVSGSVSPITGPPNICVGTTAVFSSSPAGGVWTSTNTSVATIDATGNATGITSGSTDISYSIGGCTTGMAVSVITMTSILGPTTVCPGGTISLSSATAGGSWSSDNTSVATVSATGVVSGITGGTVNISYSIGTCSAVTGILVNTLPAITGTPSVCPGGTTGLSNTTAGGVWTSTNTSVATVSGTGVVTGITSGTSSISYTVGTCAVGVSVTVAPLPAITGTTTLCVGATTALSNSTGGGIWTSTNTSVATVDAAGVVTGVSTGSANISYTAGSCSVGIAVNVSGALGPISGPSTVCVGSSIQLSNTTSGGAWTSTNTSAATVSAIGNVTGVAAGSTNISYSVGGCTVGYAVTVNSLPAIVGPTSVCVGETIQLSNAVPGGAWASGNVSAATVTSNGLVSGVAPGTSSIAYSVSGCTASVLVTVSAAVAAITGPTTVCAGATIGLSSSTSGGAWASDNGAAGTISGTGVVTGVAPGTTNISYTVGGCAAGVAVTVLASSAGTISGLDTLCKGVGHEVTLTSTIPGGTWTSSNTSRAIVDPTTGVVTGVSTGVFTITYTVSNACGTFTVTNAMYVRTPSKCATQVGVANNTPNGLTVAPNPNNGIFTAQVNSDIDEEVHIVITNIVGEKVNELHTVTNKTADIKLDYAPGIYLITAATAHERYVTKVVVR